MTKSIEIWLCCAAAFLLWLPAVAGDRSAVLDVLHSIPTNWPDAELSVDIEGPTVEGDVVLNQPIHFSYEAAVPGYVTYLRVSSHGDMTLSRTRDAAHSSGTGPSIAVKPPLGREHLIVLLSNKPLDALFPAGEDSVSLGSDASSAADFNRRLAQLEAADIRIAVRNRHYMVATADKGTEYTTRGIIRKVEGEQSPRVSIPSRVEFEFDSDRLTDQGKLDLDTFGEALISGLKDRHVTLEGHTDAMGTDAYNMDLSMRRAEAAKEYLVRSFGLPANALATMGMGKNEPIAPNDSEENRRLNRRVEFIFSRGATDPGR